MLRPAHRETELAARPKPFGVLIFDNWSERGRLRKRRRPQTSKEAASLLGCAIGVRYASDSTPILQPQSDARERNVYVLFVAKTNRSSFAKGYGGQEGNKP